MWAVHMGWYCALFAHQLSPQEILLLWDNYLAFDASLSELNMCTCAAIVTQASALLQSACDENEIGSFERSQGVSQVFGELPRQALAQHLISTLTEARRIFATEFNDRIRAL